jgi:hypothetical protein
MRHFYYLVSGVFLALSCFAPVAGAAIIFESGTLGPTGVPYSELGDIVPGTNIKATVFAGARFELKQSVVISQIGGHFVSQSNGTFFGAIITLTDENDFPDSVDFTTSDFVGSTVLDFPLSSQEVFGNLDLKLEPGWYALVFGSGLFGASGSGGAVRNGIDIDNPSYIVALPRSTDRWNDITAAFPNHRFVVQGDVVPEPSSMILVVSTSLLPFIRRI